MYRGLRASPTLGKWIRVAPIAAAVCSLVTIGGWILDAGHARAAASEGHRVLVLVRRPGGEGLHPSKLLLLNAETAETLAQTDVGYSPHIGLSQDGTLVAVASDPRGHSPVRHKLTVYETHGLNKVKEGFLAFRDMLRYTVIPPFPEIVFSADNSRVFTLRRHGRSAGGPEVEIIYVTPVLWQEAADPEYGELRTDTSVTLSAPHCGYPRLLSAQAYPRVDVYCPGGCSVDSLDFQATKVVQRLAVSDASDVSIDPSAKHPAGGTVGGAVIGKDGHGYFIPMVGFIRKLGLKGAKPFVAIKGDVQYERPDLNHFAICATEEALYVGKKSPENQSYFSRQILVFSTRDLKLQRTISCSIPFNYLEVSNDGKYLYALKWSEETEPQQLAVIDAATGKEVNMLGNFGVMPCVVMALPEQ